MEFRRKVPTLLELCKQIAIANLRHIGDVGQMDIHLLKEFLPHCTMDQLTQIENSTKCRDLSPVTDALWKRFYEQQFGMENTNTVIRRMKKKKVVFKWRHLFEAKTKETEEVQNKLAERLKQRYAETLAKKQSRQIQICSKVPPSSCKRTFNGGSGPSSNFSSNLMKKAKLESINSHEARIHAVMRKKTLQRNSFTHQRPNNLPCTDSASSSRTAKPVARK